MWYTPTGEAPIRLALCDSVAVLLAFTPIQGTYSPSLLFRAVVRPEEDWIEQLQHKANHRCVRLLPLHARSPDTGLR